MKRWMILVSVAALILIVGLGCSSKKSDKSGGGGGVLTLTSSASPPGILRENSQLPLTVTLTANRTGALIYYTSGGTPADPTTSSPIFDPVAPIVIDGTYAEGTYVIKYFAWYQDPVTLNMEQEFPFNTSTYKFREDIHPPTVYINPDGGSYSDPSSITITITASDSHDAPADITVKYTTDGTDPRTSGTAQSGTGDGTTVPWTGDDLTVKAYAIDQAGNESGVKTATFTVDKSGWAQEVWELINADRAAATPSVSALNWRGDWAAGCDGHCEQVYLGREAGTLVKVDTSLVTWYNSDDTQHRQLMDFDGVPATGYFVSATAVAVGVEGMTSPTDFYTMLMNNFSAQLLDPTVTDFGCGFHEDVWEAMWTYNP